MRQEVIEVNGILHQVNIFIEDRNNSAVSIGKRSINIRVPLSMQREELFRQILKMKSWARQKLIDNPDRFKTAVVKTYKDGDELAVGKNKYILKIYFKDKESSSARISGSIISLVISSKIPKEEQKKHISTLLSRCVAKKRLPDLYTRISNLNNSHFNQRLNKIFFKHNKSNWGSCSEAGNINISTRLLFAPDDVLDYICVHELAHLIEHNHSDRFWSLVERAMPDYKEKEKWFKENGDKCVF